MAAFTRARPSYLLPNFTNILKKKFIDVRKTQQSLFHCSSFFYVKGQEIKMPSLSPTMVEGKIVKWLKKEGDIINPGEVLCDIETDKAVVSLEVEEEGILAKILVAENSSKVKVGSLIALTVAEGEDWKNVESPEGIPPDTSSSSSSSSSDSESSDESEKSGVGGIPVINVTMPSLSPTMTSGTIIKWLKKEGDVINPGDVLCDIQTDKAVMSMETDEEGILAKIILPDDSKDIKVGTLIALIVAEGEDWKKVKESSVDSSPAQKKSEPETSSTSVSNAEDNIIEKTYGPAVKALLSEYQLEPNLIKSTGRSNRLLKEDVLKYIEDNNLKKKPPKVVSAPVVQSKPATPKPAAPKPVTTKKHTEVPSKTGAKYKDIELSNMRQIIASKLLESKRTIPHSYCMVSCDMAKLLDAKNAYTEEGIKVSVNDLITKATALSLQIYPKANSVCLNGEVKTSRDIDVCVAVATDTGLFTPIIKSTNLKSVVDISNEIRDLAGRAKIGKLKPEEFQGGTFTISNLGMFGIKSFRAIINPPQCGILAVGGTIERLDSDLKICKFINITLSYDRRALEEQEAAEFMKVLKYVIENPDLIVLNLKQKASLMSL